MLITSFLCLNKRNKEAYQEKKKQIQRIIEVNQVVRYQRHSKFVLKITTPLYKPAMTTRWLKRGPICLLYLPVYEYSYESQKYIWL